ncbi:CoA transferase [Streptosporangium sp. NPDC006013]|uniref:CaiB/BaiF CoA transferase family protein n=1 Tax=Streptosporangium sp. NPDC006013 TaxID=3155596 RepID=UPI0033BB76D8
MSDVTEGPLAGVRVLCVDNYLAGNYGPMLLALHGADVVKVEPPSGEAMRASHPMLETDGGQTWSHFEVRMMRGKGSIGLALDEPDDRELFERLIGAADVFWTNLRPESALRRKVDPDTIRGLNDRIVYASLSGFGLPRNGEGEFGAMPAFDILVQGLGGLMGRNAEEDGTPVYNGLPLADQATSLFGAFGVLVGLRERDRTGHGCVVDVSMFDSMVALNEKAITMFGMSGEVPPPRASATTAPFGMFRCADGWVCVAVGSDAVWKRFCRAVGAEIGRPGLEKDERLAHGTGRVAHLAEVGEIVEEFTRPRAIDEVVATLLTHNVPAGRPLEVDELLGTRQVRERGVVRGVRLASGAEVPVVMSPVHVSGVEQAVSPPPRLDRDRDRLLAQWLGGRP